MRESSRTVSNVSDDVIFVLGAGVDRVLGLPLVSTLFRDLSDFASGPGAAINKAIRSHARHVPLDLQTYAGDQVENLGQKLLGSDPHLLTQILNALDKHRDAANERIKAIKTLMKKLAAIANENELNEPTMAELSKLASAADSGVMPDSQSRRKKPTTDNNSRTGLSCGWPIDVRKSKGGANYNHSA